ncbi:hypothetical protein OAO87_03285 [bacterium]|nr:hypothetical protein [bacterium]
MQAHVTAQSSRRVGPSSAFDTEMNAVVGAAAVIAGTTTGFPPVHLPGLSWAAGRGGEQALVPDGGGGNFETGTSGASPACELPRSFDERARYASFS